MIQKGGAILKIISILLIVMIFLKLCLVFLWPFAGAVLLSIFLEPAVDFVKGYGFKRKTSVLIVFSFSVIFIFFIIFYVSTYLYNHLSSIASQLPETLKIFVERLSFLKHINIEYEKIFETLKDFVITYSTGLINALISTMGGAIYIIIILINSLFISLDLDKINYKIIKILPQNFYIICERVINKINQIMNVEIRLMLISVFLVLVGLYILGQEDALTIGLICGILDLLPVVGPGIIFVPWALYELILQKYFTAIGLILLYILLEVSREIMHIKFMGSSLKIHPVAAIFSLYIGFIIYGIWGVVVGPMLCILFQELISFYYEGRSLEV